MSWKLIYKQLKSISKCQLKTNLCIILIRTITILHHKDTVSKAVVPKVGAGTHSWALVLLKGALATKWAIGGALRVFGSIVIFTVVLDPGVFFQNLFSVMNGKVSSLIMQKMSSPLFPWISSKSTSTTLLSKTHGQMTEIIIIFWGHLKCCFAYGRNMDGKISIGRSNLFFSSLEMNA